jgi:hypothetical protein
MSNIPGYQAFDTLRECLGSRPVASLPEGQDKQAKNWLALSGVSQSSHVQLFQKLIASGE